MTWNIADLPKAQRPEADQVVLAAPAQMPRQERAERLLLLTDETVPADARREMQQAGLVDETTWGVWRRLVTRGVYEL